MKTFYDIIKDVSNLRWSIVDPEPETFAEVQKAVRLAIPQAHSYIWGLDDFPFKNKVSSTYLEPGQNAILAPKGTIVNVWIDGQNTYLNEIKPKEADFLTPQEGKPTKYWIEFNEQGMVLKTHPMPAEKIVLKIRYIDMQKAKNVEGELKYNLEADDDVLNLPDDRTIEDLYLHCLNTKSMVYLVADDTDENYQPYEREFQEAYRALLKLTGTRREPYLII